MPQPWIIPIQSRAPSIDDTSHVKARVPENEGPCGLDVNYFVSTIIDRNVFEDEDFSTLIRFLSCGYIPESYPFDKEQRDERWKLARLPKEAENIFPSFLEFIRRKYFSVNEPIPGDIMRVLGKAPLESQAGEDIMELALERPLIFSNPQQLVEEIPPLENNDNRDERRDRELKRHRDEECMRLKTNPIVQRGILGYVNTQNETIMSSRCSDQCNALAFNLFLLWADIDFSLMKSVYSGRFDEIQVLLADSSLKIDIFVAWSKSIKEQYEGVWDIPENLVYQLQRHVQICETLNKLALIHAVNFEERQVSLVLGNLIRGNIDELLRNLEPLIWDYPNLRNYFYQLDNIAGKVQWNFARGRRINGSSVEEILKQGWEILQELQEAFERRKGARFWCALNEDPTEREERAKMILKGETAVIRLIMSELISNLPDQKSPQTSHDRSWPIRDLVEVYRYATGVEILTKDTLIRHFMNGGAENAKNDFPIEAVYNIVLYDDSISKNTLADLVRFFLKHSEEPQSSSYEEYTIKIISHIIRRLRTCDHESSILLANHIRNQLERQDVSHHVLNYSKLYLALALCYAESSDSEYIGYAKHCFAHYKSLSMHIESDDKIRRRYKKDEEWFYAAIGYGMLPIHSSDIQLPSLQDRQYYSQFVTLGSGTIVKDMEDRRNDAVSGIAKTSSDMIASMTGEGNRISDSFWKDNEKRIAKTIFYDICTVEIRCGSHDNVSIKREYETREIVLNTDSSIVFTYPLSSEKLFDRIFSQYRDLIKQDIGNLIAIYNQKMKDEWLATHNAETGLSNWNALKDTLKNNNEKSDPYHIVCVRMEEQNHNTEAIRANIIDYVVAGIKNVDANIIPYHTSFAFVFLLPARHFAHNEVIDFVNGFEQIIKVEGPQSVHKAYIGYAIQQWDTLPMELYDQASLALEQSARCGWVTPYTPSLQQESDTKEKNSRILREALTNQSEEWELVPFYQEIEFGNGTPKYEALMRVHNKKTGAYFPPQPFLDAIEWSSSDQKDISFRMFDRIIGDMGKYPQLCVSFNMHTFDFGDEAVYSHLLNLDPRLCKRITIEILESVDLNDTTVVRKVRNLKRLWFSIAFDDAGKARANVDRFYQYPSPDSVKIDGYYITRLYHAYELLSQSYSKLDVFLGNDPDTLNEINKVIVRDKLLPPNNRGEVIGNIQEYMEGVREPKLRDILKHIELCTRRFLGKYDFLSSQTRLIKEQWSMVIAEFVENETIRSILETMGVEWFQWYGIRKPLPIEDIFPAD